MNMKKLLCVITAMLMAFSALALAEDDLQAQLDAANARIAELEAQVELYFPYYEMQIVAEYGENGIVWLSDAQAEYEAAAQSYSQYGLSIDDYADVVKQQILESLVRKNLLKDKAVELGLADLDEETLAGLSDQAAENFENLISMYTPYFSSEDATEEDARAQTLSALEQYGVTQDVMYQELLDSYVDEQLHSHVTADVDVTDEEIQAAYDQMVADAEVDYEDDHTYVTARNNGQTIAWNPEGYRAVKHVLIKFDDEQSARYSDLQSTLSSLNAELEALDAPADENADEEAADTAEGEEEPAEPRTREEIQSDIGKVAAEIEALYSQLLPKAEQVIDEFNSGADFQTLIDTYNQDPGMNTEPTATLGYPVTADTTV